MGPSARARVEGSSIPAGNRVPKAQACPAVKWAVLLGMLGEVGRLLGTGACARDAPGTDSR